MGEVWVRKGQALAGTLLLVGGLIGGSTCYARSRVSGSTACEESHV